MSNQIVMNMKERILELLNDVVYEICDEFGNERVAELVIEIVDKINNHVTPRRISIGEPVDVEIGKFQFRVNNRHQGFVSCSDTEEGCTGLSETMYFPYYHDSDDPDAGLRNLIEMLNEAYYACVNVEIMF